ncbi:hypothetical protein FB192DRAFT_1346157 [Mucor lusitanicus]|uniref:Uncharacterized protein n=2 Tax=Mucor circinelloides f. lusitanicus TaxID=29924 RepID=A0A168NTX3_MUCCL|nr:hypothetical protein FB192DRAFT_1346157 [Mucor lusitanicus]OAD06733.1 hypothetical protein MUCCIDRAFT_160366 [Mucor lusitanicus CBS 277.49]
MQNQPTVNINFHAIQEMHNTISQSETMSAVHKSTMHDFLDDMHDMYLRGYKGRSFSGANMSQAVWDAMDRCGQAEANTGSLDCIAPSKHTFKAILSLSGFKNFIADKNEARTLYRQRRDALCEVPVHFRHWGRMESARGVGNENQKRQFIPMDASVYNSLQVIYRNVYKHAMDRLREKNSVALPVGCYACYGAERKLVSMDGNFSWKRRKDRASIKDNSEQGIFTASSAEIALIAPPEEVELFHDYAEATDEECLLQDLDSDFRAGSSDRRRQNATRFDESGVFSLNCARHGIVERVFDIFGGEGHKYALAAISHVVEGLGNEEKLGVLYDIVCKCHKRIEIYS